MAPDKIYLYPYATDGIYEVETRPSGDTIEYIRKDALLEWAKEQVNEKEIAMETGADVRSCGDKRPVLWGQSNAFKQMIDKIGSM